MRSHALTPYANYQKYDWGIVDLPVTQLNLTEGCSKYRSFDPYACGGQIIGSWPCHPYYFLSPCSTGCGVKNYTFEVLAYETYITTPNADDVDDYYTEDYCGYEYSYLNAHTITELYA